MVLVAPRPQVPMWTSRIGLGVRGTGQVINDGWNNLGIGGEFLYRASPHLVTELAAEYQRSAGSRSQLDRVDVPVTFGLRVHIGRPDWVVSPYFVFAGGVGYASQDLRFTTDDAIYLEGQLGGGLELRLGQHVAVTADARLDAKKRANGVADNVARHHQRRRQAGASARRRSGRPVPPRRRRLLLSLGLALKRYLKSPARVACYDAAVTGDFVRSARPTTRRLLRRGRRAGTCRGAPDRRRSCA